MPPQHRPGAPHHVFLFGIDVLETLMRLAEVLERLSSFVL